MTVLYLMMVVAAGVLWAQHKRVAVKPALSLYAAQLLLNALWTVVFFGMQLPGSGMVLRSVRLGALVDRTHSGLITAITSYRTKQYRVVVQ